MSFTSCSCVVVECDGPASAACPHEQGWPGDEGPFHFPSQDDALAYVLGDAGMGWTRLPDGRLLCKGCADDIDCQTTGHQWTPWRRGLERGGIPTDVEFRFCTHCPAGFEERFAEMGETP